MSYRGFPQSFLARVTSLKKTTFTVNMWSLLNLWGYLQYMKIPATKHVTELTN
jgi:hypothetical protein